MRSALPIVLLAAAAVLAGCGDRDSRDEDAARKPEPRTEQRTQLEEPSCGGPAMPLLPERLSTNQRRKLDRELADATRVATRQGHRFVTELRVTVLDGLSATAELDGHRTPGGRSEAQLTWSGAAALVLPRMSVRIANDTISIRTAGEREWRTVGSASGIALDVGRELLTHPFLLEVDAERTTPRGRDIGTTAPADQLRTYASTERRGIATDLLSSTRSLRLVSRIEQGELVGDWFRLVTAVPAAYRGRAGGDVVTVVGTTGYCPLP